MTTSCVRGEPVEEGAWALRRRDPTEEPAGGVLEGFSLLRAGEGRGGTEEEEAVGARGSRRAYGGGLNSVDVEVAVYGTG